jgi:hypothetical protein
MSRNISASCSILSRGHVRGKIGKVIHNSTAVHKRKRTKKKKATTTVCLHIPGTLKNNIQGHEVHEEKREEMER